MSYIRSTSNPEGLYVYEGTKGIYFQDLKRGVICDQKDFKTFVTLFSNGYWDYFSYKNISIKEVNKNNNFKIILTIDNTEFEMWYVTWMYIMNNILRTMKVEKRNRNGS